MTVAAAFLDELKEAAARAEAAEASCRQELARRLALIERERVVAFRRLNLMRAVSDAVAQAEDEEASVAAALGALRAKIGWMGDSDARTEVASRFAPVARALYRDQEPSEPPEYMAVQAALADFESWYAGARQSPFWDLFDTYIVETPRVDF